MLIIKHGAGLSDNLSGREIPLHSEQRGQAELAVHGATDLARNANGGAVPGSRFFYFVPSLAAVSGFAIVAFRHPDRFNALTVGEAN
jgi:hypothetical protein